MKPVKPYFKTTNQGNSKTKKNTLNLNSLPASDVPYSLQFISLFLSKSIPKVFSV